MGKGGGLENPFLKSNFTRNANNYYKDSLNSNTSLDSGGPRGGEVDAKFVKGKHLFIGKIFIIILKMRNATIYDFALIFICRRPEKMLILIFFLKPLRMHIYKDTVKTCDIAIMLSKH